MGGLVQIGFLSATILFVLGMKLMGKAKNAKNGNLLLVAGMIVSIVSTVFLQLSDAIPWTNLIVLFVILFLGIIIGKKISFSYEITRMPELVSLFNAFGGISAVIIVINSLIASEGPSSIGTSLIFYSSILFGSMSFSGSIVAFLKLGGKKLKAGKYVSHLAWTSLLICLLIITFGFIVPTLISPIVVAMTITVFALLYGTFFAMGIGGADMPILISILNALTGLVTAISGVLFESPIMILVGVFVGATGVILTIQMCLAMNRSLASIIFAKSKSTNADALGDDAVINFTETTPSQLASALSYSSKVAIIPGFGLAAARAQKMCYELKAELDLREIELKFIIHPVAGRMPGHMNVLLAEANIDYDDILDMNATNDNMDEFDVCIVIGANDVVNPAAEEDPESSIYGMPIIRAHQAKKVIVIKRSLSSGYAGIKNPLFEKPNCSLLLMDAKKGLEDVLIELKKMSDGS